MLCNLAAGRLSCQSASLRPEPKCPHYAGWRERGPTMGETEIDWRKAPLFERSCFDRLSMLPGDARRQAVTLYRQLAPARKLAMLQAAWGGQFDQLAGLAHLVKGGSGTLGLLRLAALCEMIEVKAPDAALDPAEIAVAIEREFDAVMAQLEQLQ